MRITCSKYSDLDDKVIAKATELGLPLIGGTALEIWAHHFKHPGVRRRSNNDLDFICSDLSLEEEFKLWVQEFIDPDKVEVDIMHIESHDFAPFIEEVDGVLVMSLSYLLWSKLVRHSEKDIQDIKWILSIPQLSDDEIVNTLEELGVTDDEIELLNNI